jgi:capsular exopolysaccharide synthesis family protein
MDISDKQQYSSVLSGRERLTFFVTTILRKALHFWYLIVSIMLLFALIGYQTSKKEGYVYSYVARASFISTQTNSSGSPGSGASSSGPIPLTGLMQTRYIQTYMYVMKSSYAASKVSADLKAHGYNISAAAVRSSVSLSQVSNSGIIEVKCITSDRDTSYLIVEAVMRVVPEVLSTKISTAEIVPLDPPRAMKDPLVSGQVETFKPLFYAVAGLIASIGVIAAFEILSKTVKSPDQVTNVIGLQLLGTVPKWGIGRQGSFFAARKKRKLKPFVVLRSADFAFVESYKALRTKIESTAMQKQFKSFIITSTSTGEGKTITAINLATTLSQKGQKVLLLDCNLHNSKLADTLGIAAESVVPLGSVLRSRSAKEDAIKVIMPFGFHALFLKEEQANSAELLGSKKMKELIDALCMEFDYVIIDAPDIKSVPDTIELSQFCDAIIYVLRENVTNLYEAGKLLGNFADTKAEILGGILNCSVYSLSMSTYTRYYTRNSRSYRNGGGRHYGDAYGQGENAGGYGYGYGGSYGYGYSYDGRRYNDENKK